MLQIKKLSNNGSTENDNIFRSNNPEPDDSSKKDNIIKNKMTIFLKNLRKMLKKTNKES